MSANLSHDELSWLAFRYVGQELSGSESEEFEARLAVDQAAREAVAAAELLCQAVCAAEQVADWATPQGAAAATERVVQRPAAPGRRLLTWVASAAACAVLIALLPSGWKWWQATDLAGSSAAEQDLAELWAQAAFHREDAAVVGATGSPFSPNLPAELAATEMAELDSLMADGPTESFAVPNWMVEALAPSSESEESAKTGNES